MWPTSLPAVEDTRRLTAKEKVLRLLESKGSATNVELNAICFRFGARLYELRKEGFDITRENGSGPGVFRYVFKGRAVPDPALPFD